MKLEIDLVVYMECNVARHISPRLYLFARQASRLPSSAHIL